MSDFPTARWFPGMPPMLDGEDADAYTDRLTGADRTGRIPYDHDRNRQCSIGYHDECSERAKAPGSGGGCQCPCHTETGTLELRVRDLEEALVAAYAVASGRRTGERAVGILRSLQSEVASITTNDPQFGRWYLSEEDSP